jgi:SAM-dependent methyltransferase
VFGGLDVLSPGGEESTRRLAVELALHRKSRVLELGAGHGLTACRLARAIGCAVVATDIDPTQLEATLNRVQQEGLTDRVEVRFADMRSLFAFFPGERFDAVFAEGVFDYVPLAQVAPHAHALLGPEGTFAFTRLCWKGVALSDIPQDVGRAFSGLTSQPIVRLEGVLDALADQGFHKGFAYERPAADWEAWLGPVALRLEQRATERDLTNLEQRWQRVVELLKLGALDHIGCFVCGGFPDAKEE